MRGRDGRAGRAGARQTEARFTPPNLMRANLYSALTERINPQIEPAPAYLLNKHYQRKHRPHAYYGQGNA